MGPQLSIALIVHHQLVSGSGAPGSTLTLAEALRARGHRVDVLGLEIAGSGESLLTHLRFPFAAARFVRRAFRTDTYDVIDASTGDLWMLTRREIANSTTAVLTRSHGLEALGATARREGRRRKELALRWRYNLYHGGWRLHEVRRTLKNADAVLVLNESEREFVTSLGVQRDGIVRTSPLAGAAFSAIPDTSCTQSVAVLGGEQWRKGGRDNAQFITELLQTNDTVSVTWLGISSSGVKGAIPSELQSRVRGVEHFDVESANEIFRQHAVVVLLSRFEGLPLTILEAMSHGCVIVGTAIGGLEELARSSGGVVAVGDITAAVSATTDALVPSTWSELSRRSASAAQRFAPSHVVDVLEDNYRRAIELKASSRKRGTP